LSDADARARRRERDQSRHAEEDWVVFRYRDNPNGSQRDIAGICSANRRVVGLMPHPEHATEALTGPSDDGLGIFYSALDSVLAA
ncbi:phosphoribosylformylglycinamidine synthase subunit PurQ, partial [Mycolicibacterium holsaticum]|uniref:phosphoribosylformylglycinamidine synthase subunit PurQ n=1 Tax=Mycolicibacterium holsaticum TaxID=152142 RepID=UPI001F20AF57